MDPPTKKKHLWVLFHVLLLPSLFSLSIYSFDEATHQIKMGFFPNIQESHGQDFPESVPVFQRLLRDFN